jgi:hypothetical protein
MFWYPSGSIAIGQIGFANTSSKDFIISQQSSSTGGLIFNTSGSQRIYITNAGVTQFTGSIVGNGSYFTNVTASKILVGNGSDADSVLYVSGSNGLNSVEVDNYKGQEVFVINSLGTSSISNLLASGSLFGTATTASYISMTYASNSLSAPVTISNANTLYNGPAVRLTAGTWLVQSNVTVGRTVNAVACRYYLQVWDGSSKVYASTEENSAAMIPQCCDLSAGSIINLAASTNITASCKSTLTGSYIYHVSSGSIANASIIYATKLG